MSEQEASSAQTVDPLTQKIVKQVDFYFSDSNFARDKFLQETVKKSEGGWVPLSVMLKFNRLAQLSKDEDVIASALLHSDLIEVSEDRKSIRRSPSQPLPEERDFNARSIYAKGFPTDLDKFEPVEEFFAAKGYKVLSVRLRRHQTTKAFKGSAFIEFDTPENAQKAASETHEFNGNQLTVMLKEDYFKMKKDKYAESKKEQTKKAPKAKKQEDDDDEEEQELKFEPGCLLSLKNIPEKTTREDLKTTFAAFGEVAWVEFDRDDTEGIVRFKNTGEAAKAAEAFKEGKAQLNGATPDLKVLEGDEEKNHYAKIEAEKRERFGKNRGRGRGRGGARGGQKRRHDGGDRSGKRKKE